MPVVTEGEADEADRIRIPAAHAESAQAMVSQTSAASVAASASRRPIPLWNSDRRAARLGLGIVGKESSSRTDTGAGTTQSYWCGPGPR